MGRLISDLAIGNYYVVVYTYVLQGHMRMYTCVYSIVYIRLKSERSGSHLSFYLIKHLHMRILKLNLHDLDIKILQGLRGFFYFTYNTTSTTYGFTSISSCADSSPL